MTRFAPALLALLLTLVACDSGSHVDLVSSPLADARVEGGTYTVGASAGGAWTSADVLFQLSGLPRGATFRSSVLDASEREVAALSQRSTPSGYEFAAHWAGSGTARLEALRNGQIVYSAPVSGSGHPLGVTDATPTSKHYVAPGHVVYDYTLAPGGTTQFRPAGGGLALIVTDLRVVFDGLPAGFSTLRFSCPPTTSMTLLQEQLSR